MRRIGSIIVWSAISAAFIGPGTVTTAGAAGARFELRLLWAIVLSTAVCLVLQEASARLTVSSGQDLAQAIRSTFGAVPAVLVVGSVVLGCAAFEAGNILGAAAGAALMLPLPARWIAGGSGLVAATILISRSPRRVARIMGVLVGIMGIAFLAAALGIRPDPSRLLRAALVPSVPTGSAALVLGLFGTTVVPYNLFLGSRLARGQRLADVRLGLAVAVPLGGLITMGVAVVGTAVEGPFSYQGLAAALVERLGGWASVLFAVGLFVAGITSAVTAPLAAAVTVSGLTTAPDSRRRPHRIRLVWLSVLLVGIGFGVAGVPPIPAIILAQAANGILLPFVAVALLVAINDRRLMGAENLSRWASNGSLVLAVFAALTLGVTATVRAVERTGALPPVDERWIVVVSLLVAVALAVPIARSVMRRRSPSNDDRAG